MIAPQFYPLVGGYERAAERLAVELVNRGHAVTVVAERRNREWPSKQVLGGVRIRRIWCAFRPGWHAFTSSVSFVVFLMLNGRRFDVLHVHQYGLHLALAVALRSLLGKPVVLKLTSTATQGISQAIGRKRSSHSLLIKLHQQVNALIATSAAAVKEAVQFGIPKERIYLISNGIDTERYAPCSLQDRAMLKKRLGYRRPFTVLYTARLAPAKNPTGLLQAWSLIHRELSDCELVLVGDGPLRQELVERIGQLGLSDSVQLVGYQQDVVPWYQVADVFVLPSHHEGLSNSLLEALSCGLPVVSTRVSGSTDVFSEADVGELVEVGDMMEFAKALRGLLTNPERRKLCGVSARQYAVEKCSIRAVAKATLELYQALGSV